MTYRAELVAEHAGLRLDRDISPYSLQPSPRFCLLDGEVFVLDETLTATAQRSVRLSSGARLLNAAMDLSVVVAADQSALVVVAAGECRLPLPGAQVACVFPGGHVLVTAPVTDTGHQVLLIDPDGGQVLDEVLLDAPDSYVSAAQHPVAPLAVLTAGAGQDGSRLFSVAEVDRRLVTEALAENVIATSFNPSGTRLLITGHLSFRPVLGVLSWPDGKPIRSMTAPELGLPDDSLGVCGCYLDDDRVLALTEGGRVLALSDRLDGCDEVSLTAVSQRPGFLIGVSPVSFAVQTWRDGAADAWVWRLPSRPAP